MSQDYNSLAHSKWDCKYHVVFIPKHRRKALYGQIRPELGKIFHALAAMKDCTIVEGHATSICSSKYHPSTPLPRSLVS